MTSSKKKLNIIFLSILLLALKSGSAPTWADDGLLHQDRASESLKLLASINKDEMIASKWNKFLEEGPRLGNRFDNLVHQAALNDLKKRYDGSIENYEGCIRKINQECKKDSSLIRKLEKKYGYDYVRRNAQSLKVVIFALYMSNSTSVCEDYFKEVLYREYLYLDAVKNYVRIFLEFYETLNSKEKEKLTPVIEAASSFLKEFYYPYQEILSDAGLRSSLYAESLKKTNLLTPEVIDFISNHSEYNKQCLPGESIRILNTMK